MLDELLEELDELLELDPELPEDTLEAEELLTLLEELDELLDRSSIDRIDNRSPDAGPGN
ncbi:MAG: hypothetical protein WC277_09965 [Bacilli bacterium]